MQRRDRIVILLTFYNDVREGFKDAPRTDSGGAVRFHSTWSAEPYLQLRALLSEMRRLSPSAWRHLAGVYLHCLYVRRSRCPACGTTFPPSRVAKPQHCDGYSHGRKQGRSVTLEPYMEKVVGLGASARVSNLAVDWLDARWQGECDLPRELLDVLSARAVEGLKRGKPLVIAA